MADDRTQIGTVEKVSPGQRRLRIEMPKSYVAYAMTLKSLECRQRDGKVINCRIATSTQTGDGIAVTVVPGVPRDTIAQLKKCRIVVKSDEVVRDSNRYDAEELNGLTVVDAMGVRVARVVSGFETRANAMIELKLSSGSVMILPVVPEVVRLVDWSTQRLVLMPDIPLENLTDEEDGVTHA